MDQPESSSQIQDQNWLANCESKIENQNWVGSSESKIQDQNWSGGNEPSRISLATEFLQSAHIKERT